MDPFILGAATLLPFLLTSFVIELTPGPNMATVAGVASCGAH
ncbi:hypothetical protein ACQKGL_09125 [Ensifer adhaerens]